MMSHFNQEPRDSIASIITDALVGLAVIFCIGLVCLWRMA